LKTLPEYFLNSSEVKILWILII